MSQIIRDQTHESQNPDYSNRKKNKPGTEGRVETSDMFFLVKKSSFLKKMMKIKEETTKPKRMEKKAIDREWLVCCWCDLREENEVMHSFRIVKRKQSLDFSSLLAFGKFFDLVFGFYLIWDFKKRHVSVLWSSCCISFHVIFLLLYLDLRVDKLFTKQTLSSLTEIEICVMLSTNYCVLCSLNGWFCFLMFSL